MKEFNLSEKIYNRTSMQTQGTISTINVKKLIKLLNKFEEEKLIKLLNNLNEDNADFIHGMRFIIDELNRLAGDDLI